MSASITNPEIKYQHPFLGNLLERKTISTTSAAGTDKMAEGYLQGYMPSTLGKIGDAGYQKVLNPSKEASAFTQSYNVVRETKSFGQHSDGSSSREVVPLTKVQIVPSDTTENPKHIYVNVSMQNNNSQVGIPAILQFDFDQPFLKNTEKYFLTIAKAVFPTTSIPLFEFELNKYWVYIEYPPASYIGSRVYLKPNSIERQSNGKYYVYHYQRFIDSFNAALMESFYQMLIAVPGYTGTIPPYIVYDTPTNRFSIVAQQDLWYSSAWTLTSSLLYTDYYTYRLFNSLPGSTIIGKPGGEVALSLQNGGSNNSYIYNGINPLMTTTMTNYINGGVWDERILYVRGSVVTYLGSCYAAIQGSVNQNPTNPTYWQVQGASTSDPGIYASSTTYVISQVIYYPTANSVPFISLQYPNLNHTPDPTAATAYWRPLTSGFPMVWSPGTSYVANMNVYYPTIGGQLYRCILAVSGTTAPPSDVTHWLPANQFVSTKTIGEYSTLSQWSDVESIVIASGSLPIRYEIYTPPVSDSAVSGTQVPKPILTDLDPYISTDGFDRSQIQYVPSGPYRLIDLLAKEELRRIDLFLQYKHNDLSFSDLILLPGDYFSAKLLFIRADTLQVG